MLMLRERLAMVEATVTSIREEAKAKGKCISESSGEGGGNLAQSPS